MGFSEKQIKQLENFCEARKIVIPSDKDFNLIVFLQEFNKASGEMLTRLSNITNELDSFIRDFGNEEAIYKLLLNLGNSFNIEVSEQNSPTGFEEVEKEVKVEETKVVEKLQGKNKEEKDISVEDHLQNLKRGAVLEFMKHNKINIEDAEGMELKLLKKKIVKIMSKASEKSVQEKIEDGEAVEASELVDEVIKEEEEKSTSKAPASKKEKDAAKKSTAKDTAKDEDDEFLDDIDQELNDIDLGDEDDSDDASEEDDDEELRKRLNENDTTSDIDDDDISDDDFFSSDDDDEDEDEKTEEEVEEEEEKKPSSKKPQQKAPQKPQKEEVESEEDEDEDDNNTRLNMLLKKAAKTPAIIKDMEFVDKYAFAKKFGLSDYSKKNAQDKDKTLALAIKDKRELILKGKVKF